MQKLLLPILLTLSLGLSACAEDEEISLPPPKAQSSEPKTPAQVAPPAASEEGASSMEEPEEHNAFQAKSGFPTDCEAYMKDMGQCIDKLGSSNRDMAEQYQETLNNSVEAWKGMDYESATTACRQATEFWQKTKGDIGC